MDCFVDPFTGPILCRVSEFSPAAVTQIRFQGNGGNDRFTNSTAKYCQIYGGVGDDTLIGGSAGDDLFGEDGNDELHGNGGDDNLAGGDGNDSLYGGADTLDGGTGSDALFGEAGNDWLDGGPRDHEPDTLIGGAGGDRFVFDAPDTLTDVSINDGDFIVFIRYT